MILYAIRHRPTGLFMPRYAGRGSTHREPTAELAKARLWSRAGDANGFLTVWLRGKQTMRACQSSHESFCNDDVEWNCEKVPSRKRQEMEIVAFELHEQRRLV